MKKLPQIERPRWDSVLLVCKACAKRGNGPDDVKPKELAGTARRALKHGDRRSRVVMTGCLGLCPKAATAVAFAGDDATTRIVAIRSVGQLEGAIGALAARRPAIMQRDAAGSSPESGEG